MNAPPRIWIARPPGRFATFDPEIVCDEQDAQDWRALGWDVIGPYVLQEPTPPTDGSAHLAWMGQS